MAFQNVDMTEEEGAWEETLGLKDPYLEYKEDLISRPDGSIMTVDREREMYLFSIRRSGDPRDLPSQESLYYFCFYTEDGLLLYFTSGKESENDKITWHITSIDLFKNVKKRSKAEIFELLSEALYTYGRDGLDPLWSIFPAIPGIANYNYVELTGDWIG